MSAEWQNILHSVVCILSASEDREHIRKRNGAPREEASL